MIYGIKGRTVLKGELEDNVWPKDSLHKKESQKQLKTIKLRKEGIQKLRQEKLGKQEERRKLTQRRKENKTVKARIK